MTVTERFRNETTFVWSDDGDLTFERTFDAPRELVWKAFTDPAAIPRWWGPHGTTTVVEEPPKPQQRQQPKRQSRQQRKKQQRPAGSFAEAREAATGPLCTCRPCAGR